METTAKKRYEDLVRYRSNVETRAEKYAEWTIPNIFPDSSSNDSDAMTNALNSIGAEALNNLTNKLLLALFSPGNPFFRVDLKPETKVSVMQLLQLEEETELDALMSGVEKETMKVLGRKGLRDAAFAILQQLVVTGNALLHYPEGKDMVVYTLRDYVVDRTSYGDVKAIIVKDEKVYGSLSPTMQQAASSDSRQYKDDDVVCFYVWSRLRSDGKFEVTQWIEDTALSTEDTKGIFPKERLPYIPLTWRISRGHNYGTGLVEEYAGDFKALEVLTDSFVRGLAVAADLKQLVNPGGLTDIEDLVQAPFGAYVHGRAEDISVPQLNKVADYKLLMEGIDSFSRRIARAFLLSSQVTRQAERVTAFEIQQQINELETALGGVYTRLAATLQQPLAALAMAEVDTELSEKNGISPMVTTGIDAISRFNEMSSVQMWLQDLGMLGQLPDVAVATLNLESLGSYMASSRGIDAAKFVKTQEQMQQEQQAIQQQQAQMQAQEAATQAAASGKLTE